MATKKVKETKVKLVNFTIKAIIPTGAYANISPEITVEAETLDQANDYVMPFIESMYAKYLNMNERPPQTSAKVCSPAPTKPAPVAPPAPTEPAPVAPEPAKKLEPTGSVAFIKAEQAVKSCNSKEALAVVENQINVSTRLLPKEKAELLLLVQAKTFNE